MGNAQRTATALVWPSCLESKTKRRTLDLMTGFKVQCECIWVILPLVLFRKMVATSSFQGSWKRVSCTRLKGERGGVHFLNAFLLGGLRTAGRGWTCLLMAHTASSHAEVNFESHKQTYTSVLSGIKLLHYHLVSC